MRPLAPYIGITDFMNFDQVEAMKAVFDKNKPPGSMRALHVGVMMSYKTLNGIENKWTNAFPPKEKVAEIFRSHRGQQIYNCLHYADYNHDTKFTDLARALEYAGPFVDALQLDMPWPDPGMVASGVHTSRKNIEVILQVGRSAIELLDDDPDRVVKALKDYQGIIHRVLLDKSMGRGVGMDAKGLIPFAKAIRSELPELGLVVAGGLGPTTMHLAEPLVQEFPDISIDAQGKLRPSGSALDPVDWDMATQYLIEALKLLK